MQSWSGDISAVQGSVSVVSGAVAAEKRVLGPSLDISTDTTGPISVISLATGTYITHHLFYNMVSIPLYSSSRLKQDKLEHKFAV